VIALLGLLLTLPSRAGYGVAALHIAAPAGNVVAQAEEEGVSHDEIQKYVGVYRAMQRNHQLTVEQAAATHGLTLQAFRDLEQRIERNEEARDEARRELKFSRRGTAAVQC
jgi:hypothetical protein